MGGEHIQIKGGGGGGVGGGHPDPEIRGKGGPASKKVFFGPLFWSKNKGGAGPPGPSPGSATVVTVFSFTTAFAELQPN